MNSTHQEILLKIAKEIKHLRIKAGYSSYETFARDYQLPRAQYWRMERGTNFTLKTLLTILNIHKISLHQFYSGIK